MSTSPVRVGITPNPLQPEPTDVNGVPDGPTHAAPVAPGSSPSSRSFVRLAPPDGRAGPESRSAMVQRDPGGGQTPAELHRQGQHPGAVLERIAERLRRSAFDPAITDADVRAVHRELAALSKPALNEVLHALEARGLLTEYMAEQEPAERRAFVEQLENAGILVRRPAKPATGILDPPQGPRMVELAEAAPASLKILAHRENMVAALNYDAQRKAYVDRYVGMVQEARSAAELSLLGAPEARLSTSLHGLPDFGPTARQELNRILGRNDVKAAFQALNNREAVLAGKTPPGHFRAELGVGLNVKGTSAGATLVVAETGPELKSTLALKQGPAKISVDPVLGLAETMAPTDPGSIQSTKASAGFKLRGLGAEFDSSGTLKLEARGAQVQVNAHTGEVGAGIGRDLVIGVNDQGIRVKAEAKLVFQLSDPRNAPEIANGSGPGAPTQELLSAVPWAMLPAERQLQLQRQDIRRGFWDALMPKLQPFKLP